MDEFSFFFTFYALLLGLAVTELLTGFAGFVRERPLRSLEPQLGLLALLVFILICATWLDAWSTLRGASRGFSSLMMPVGIATAYFLAASVVFPRKEHQLDALADYFAERKRFVVTMLIVAELLVTATYVPLFLRELESSPAVFWAYHLPYNALIKLALLALLFVRSRRANLGLMGLLIMLILVPYWYAGWIRQAIG